MTREFFGRLVKIFDRFRREIDAIGYLAAMDRPYQEKHRLLEAQFNVIMELLDVQHTDSPIWIEMPIGEKIERMYLLCKAEYDSTKPSDAVVQYHRSIDLGDLSAK